MNLYVVFNALPSGEQDAQFVEVEDGNGRGHGSDVGIEWSEHPTPGLYRLGPFHRGIDDANLVQLLEQVQQRLDFVAKSPSGDANARDELQSARELLAHITRLLRI